MNLVLIGFMGTGKTTVGRKAAKLLGMKFMDTDKEIERVCGLTVSQIFKKCGEVRFRSEEKAAIRRVTRGDNRVIATGGGVVLDPENVDMLRNNGVIICLTAPPEVIYNRVSKKKTRPLLQTDDPLDTITKLLQQRQPFYACADHTINTADYEIDEVAAQVIRMYREKAKQPNEN